MNRIYLILAVALAGVLMSSSVWLRSFALQSADPAYVRKVRSIYTHRLGLDNPSGLAFLSGADLFAVIEIPRATRTRLFLMTPYRQLIAVDKADIGTVDPINLAFDSHFKRLLVFEDATNELLETETISRDQPGHSLKIRIRFQARQLGVKHPQGMTVDPATGDLFILNSSAMRIVRIKPGTNGDLDTSRALADGRISLISLHHAGLVEPRGMAFNPANGHLYVLSPSEQKVYELTTAGLPVAILDLSPFKLISPEGMVFAPSGDPTDNPSNTNLYVADAGSIPGSPTSAAGIQSPGKIVELSFAAPMVLNPSVPTVAARLVRMTETAQYSPPSPDPAGVVYLPESNALLISDCEVDEMPIFTGKNIWLANLDGTQTGTLTTYSFSDEPTGVTRDPVSRKLFFSDDNESRIWILDPGPDGLYNTADDRVTYFSTSALGGYDPEDVAFDSSRGHLLVIDGEGAEVYDVSPGANGVFDGVTSPGDDVVTHFDTASMGITDPEGIVYNPDDGHLYVVSRIAHSIAETTVDGVLVGYIDISSLDITMEAGLTYAPASSGNPGDKSFYIVDRGVDNNEDPNENDGKLYELTVNNPAATVSSLSPAAANEGGAAFTLTVGGSNFLAGSVVRWNGTDRTTTFVSSTQLQAAVPASDIAAPGSAQVSVFNPAPGGGISSAMAFTINSAHTPTITSLSPATGVTGGPAFTLTLDGTNFVAGSVVRWNGSDRSTAFVSSTRLTAAIAAADIAEAGTTQVTVFNPAPDSLTSNAMSFSINNPVPSTTSLSPAVATVGGPAFTLTINGTGFLPSSVARWNGAARSTAFVSSAQLTAAISATDIAATGSDLVTVFNPAPGGGTSNAQTFTVNTAQAPTIASLSPASAPAGGAAFALTVIGTNYVTGSVVRWNGATRTTTFISPTQLTADISASDISTVRTVTVTVNNPAPGGGTSNPQIFSVENPVPATTGVSPATVNARGPGFSLTVDGSGFVSGSLIRWNGTDRVTSYVSATRLRTSVTAADIALAGTVLITVFTPVPGGGTSNSQTLTIRNPPAPSISSLSPNTAIVGGADFTLTVGGSNFVSDSIVRWNGANRATTFVSSTKLTVAIPATDIAVAGVVPVTAFTPLPGGGTSSSKNFYVQNPIPTTTSLNPSTAAPGGPAFTLTVDGTNFVAGSVVRWNGANRTTSFVSSTRLTAGIAASDIAAPGTAQVTVYSSTKGGGGGTSNAQTFTINNTQAPTMTSLSPASAAVGGAAFALTVTGTGFASGAVVRWNGADRTTTFVAATQLTAAISAADIAIPGTAQVTVFNPPPGGGVSNSLDFTIQNPEAPTITGLSPASASAGGQAFSLIVNGSNFPNDSVVRWNGGDRTTTFVSSTQLTAAIPASDIATAGTIQVTVFASESGASNGQTFMIGNPVPVTTSLSPATAVAGGPSFTLTVSGSDFVGDSVVRWAGSNRTTTFVSSIQLAAVIAATDIVSAGTAQITVYSPTIGGGGGTSNPQAFTINYAQGPTITSLSPATVHARGAAFSLSINGTGFSSASIVRWNGVDRPGTYVSSTLIRTAVSAADIALAGAVQLSVYTPGPGGGISNIQVLTIQDPPVPTISDRNPILAIVGSPAFTLTVSGTGFVMDSVVRWNGTDRPTTFVSGTRLTAAIPAADISVIGIFPVTVFTPLPGGGTSNSKSFYVQNPVPTTTSLDPASAAAGSPAFSLTMDGTNFVADSVVRWNGANRTTTFVSPTRLTAAIPASDVTVTGTAQVTVYSPTRGGGGGASNAQTFTVTP